MKKDIPIFLIFMSHETKVSNIVMPVFLERLFFLGLVHMLGEICGVVESWFELGYFSCLIQENGWQQERDRSPIEVI